MMNNSFNKNRRTIIIVATIITVAILIPLIVLAVVFSVSGYSDITGRLDYLEADSNNAAVSLADAQYEYEVSKAQNEAELTDAKNAYDSATKQLETALEALSSAKEVYATAAASYDAAKEAADSAKIAYDMSKTALENAEARYSASVFEYDSAKLALESAQTEYQNMTSVLANATSKLTEATNAMNAAKTAYESATLLYNAMQESTTETEDITVPTISSVPTASEVFASVTDAVLEIRNYNVKGVYTSLGSGFIFDKSGLVCTNYHVISGAYELRAQYGEGDDEYYKVSYVAGFDADIDLAILKLEGDNFPTVPLATTEPKVGDTIYALGSNTGFFKTFSSSIVAYVDKEIEDFDSVKYIQYFSLTHSGNSGCPIFNANGEVIAVNQLGDTATGDHGFGIPIKYLQQISRNKKLTPMQATYAGAEEIDSELLNYETKFDMLTFSTYAIITGFKDADSVSDLVTDDVVTFPSEIDGYPVKEINMSFSASDTYAMYHYYFIEHLVIPEGVTSLKGNIFYYAPETLLTVKLPSTLKFIGSDVFDSCLGIYRFFMDNNGNKFVYLKDEVLYGVDDLGKTALLRYPFCKSDFGEDEESDEDDGEFATKVFNVPSNVNFICDFAMLYSGFTELYFPERDGSEELEIGALACCFNTNLKILSIPKNTKFIGARAFGACTALETITFEGDVDTLGEIYTLSETGLYYGAFDSCTAIQTITFNGSVKQIGDRAFLGAKITELTLPSGLEKMGKYSFARCESLTTVDASTFTLEALPEGIFDYDIALKDVTLPSALSTIGAYSFANCTVLAKITLPDSLTTIDEYAFYYDTMLKTVEFPSEAKLTEIKKYAFFNCDALVSITLPTSVKAIGAYAFSNCDALLELTIPEGVKLISEGIVFNNKAIISVTLPSTVTRIADGAFWSCPKLAEVHFNSTLPPFITELLFEEEAEHEEEDANITIYIPNGTLTAYMSESSFRYFATYEFITIKETEEN